MKIDPLVLAALALVMLWVGAVIGYVLHGRYASWLDEIRRPETDWDKAARRLMDEEAVREQTGDDRTHECACGQTWAAELMAPGHTEWRCESTPGAGLLDPNAINREDPR